MQDKTSKDKLLAPPTVAEMLDVSIGTLAVWRSNGTNQIPYLKIGRNVRYRQSAIEAYLLRQTHLHTHLKVKEIK